MNLLETKLPPVLVLSIGILLMWFLSLIMPEQSGSGSPFRLVLAVTLLAAGIILGISAVLSFRKFQTRYITFPPLCQFARGLSGIPTQGQRLHGKRVFLSRAIIRPRPFFERFAARGQVTACQAKPAISAPSMA